METIIVAPHPDDEIIGCYSILKKEKCIIIYSGETEMKRREEAMKLKNFLNITVQLFLNTIPVSFLNKNNRFFFPSVDTEIHPLHRYYGSIGESLARCGEDIIFYTTIMNVPWIHEVKDYNEKEILLNNVYPSQKSLWETDKKFILFEGYNQWRFKF